MSSISKPSRIERALDRLGAAIGKLESATEARAPNGDGAAGPEEVSALKSENARLEARNNAAKARLDGAISKLEALLKE